jgi:hypothetical protein
VCSIAGMPIFSQNIFANLPDWDWSVPGGF